MRKRQKTVSGGQVSSEGKEASDDENEYNVIVIKKTPMCRILRYHFIA